MTNQSTTINNLTRLGNFIEYYDFSLYVFLAPLLATSLLGIDSSMDSSVYGYALLAFTYFVRPIGGMLFGHLGDSLGRNHALVISIIIMWISTLSIAFIPKYSSVGIYSTFLLILCRAMQCLSLGGEFTNALVLCYESSNFNNKNKNLGLFISSGTLGWFAASTIVHISNKIFVADSDLIWRFPFFLGGIMGVFIMVLRLKYQINYIKPHSLNFPLEVKIFKKENMIKLLCTVMLAGWNGALFYGLFIYPNTYLAIKHSTKSLQYFEYTSFCMLFYLIFLVVIGCVLDTLNLKKYKYLLLIILPGIYSLYCLINIETTISLLLASIISAFITALVMNITASIIPGLFPFHIRSRIVSLFYNVGISILGSTSPLICTVLYSRISDSASFLYLGLISIIGIFMLQYLVKNLQKVL